MSNITRLNAAIESRYRTITASTAGRYPRTSSIVRALA